MEEGEPSEVRLAPSLNERRVENENNSQRGVFLPASPSEVKKRGDVLVEVDEIDGGREIVPSGGAGGRLSGGKTKKNKNGEVELKRFLSRDQQFEDMANSR